MSATPVVHLELRISARIFVKFEMKLLWYIRGLGEDLAALSFKLGEVRINCGRNYPKRHVQKHDAKLAMTTVALTVFPIFVFWSKIAAA